jgi:hypothetical protein
MMRRKIVDTIAREAAMDEDEGAVAVATAMKGAIPGPTEAGIDVIMASSSAMIDAQAALPNAGAMARTPATKARGAAPRARGVTLAASS